jgi:hypothetical protein
LVVLREAPGSGSLSAVDGPICQAIRERRTLRFAYEGGERTIEPHLHGFSAAGAEMLLAWQVDGFSRSGASVGWKMFAVAKMGEPALDAPFDGPRPDFDPVRALTRVHCALSALRVVR